LGPPPLVIKRRGVLLGQQRCIVGDRSTTKGKLKGFGINIYKPCPWRFATNNTSGRLSFHHIGGFTFTNNLTETPGYMNETSMVECLGADPMLVAHMGNSKFIKYQKNPKVHLSVGEVHV